MDAGSRPLPGWAFPATPAQPSGRKRTPDEACPSRGAVRARERLRGVGAGLAGMAFRQALQLAACGLAGGSAAVLFSAVAVGKPRGGADAGPRVVEGRAPRRLEPQRGQLRGRRVESWQPLTAGGGSPPGPWRLHSVDGVGSAEGEAGWARLA